MKKLLLALCISFTSYGFAQVKLPQPSPAQTIKQDFGLGYVEVKYSRPAAKGRTIFGDLVPYGKMWRTGANSNTTIYFSEPVEINGNKIDSGIYSIYTYPNVDSWDVVLNKATTNWGTSGYDQKTDVMKTTVKVQQTSPAVESFTIGFDNVLPQSANLVMAWANTKVEIPITVNINDKIRKSLELALKGEKKPYWSAAQFYNEYDNNPAEALKMVDQHLKTNAKQYWAWLYKARIEAKMGNKEAALKSSNTSLELATAEKNDDYIKLNKDFQASLK